MKQLSKILLMLLMVSALILSACSSPEDQSKESSPSESSSISSSSDQGGSEGTPSESDPAAESSPATNGKITYTVIVKDADGNPIEGAMVQFCDDDNNCKMPKPTDATGTLTYELAKANYHISFPEAIEGCKTTDADGNPLQFYFEDGVTVIEITLAKAS